MYYYTFHYAKSGARAVTGEYTGTKKEILEIGCELSKEKGRIIAIKRHTTGWVKESSYIIADCEKGKVAYCTDLW